MALSPEDKKDVKGALGKAMANKISKVTKDYRSGGLSAGQRIERSLKDEKSGAVRKLKVESKSIGTHGSSVTSKRGKGQLKMNAMPHWSAEDFKTARRQKEARQDR